VSHIGWRNGQRFFIDESLCHFDWTCAPRRTLDAVLATAWDELRTLIVAHAAALQVPSQVRLVALRPTTVALPTKENGWNLKSQMGQASVGGTWPM
jgi:hypothetical protein